MRELSKLINSCGFPQEYLVETTEKEIEFPGLPWLTYSKKLNRYFYKRTTDVLLSQSLMEHLMSLLNEYNTTQYRLLCDEYVHLLKHDDIPSRSRPFQGSTVALLDSTTGLGIGFRCGTISCDVRTVNMLLCCVLERPKPEINIHGFAFKYYIDSPPVIDKDIFQSRLKLLSVLIYKYTLRIRYPKDE